MSRVRALFTGKSAATARRGVVRETVLPAPSVTPPSPDGPAVRTIDALVARLREMDAPYRKCATPSCPRRCRVRTAHCPQCLTVRRQDAAALLLAAGWTLDATGGGKRWIDPVTREAYAHATAVRIAARDAARRSP